jgi:hypothetical protein
MYNMIILLFRIEVSFFQKKKRHEIFHVQNIVYLLPAAFFPQVIHVSV